MLRPLLQAAQAFFHGDPRLVVEIFHGPADIEERASRPPRHLGGPRSGQLEPLPDPGGAVGERKESPSRGRQPDALAQHADELVRIEGLAIGDVVGVVVAVVAGDVGREKTARLLRRMLAVPLD